MTAYTRTFTKMCVVTPILLTIVSLPPLAANQVPVHGTFGTTFSLTPLVCTDRADPATCVVFDAPVKGTGRVSHLGNSTVRIEQTVDFTTNPAVLVGTITITAANGDQLFGTSSATASSPDAAGIATLAGTYVFTGGTGRFEESTAARPSLGLRILSTSPDFFSFSGRFHQSGRPSRPAGIASADTNFASPSPAPSRGHRAEASRCPA